MMPNRRVRSVKSKPVVLSKTTSSLVIIILIATVVIISHAEPALTRGNGSGGGRGGGGEGAGGKTSLTKSSSTPSIPPKSPPRGSWSTVPLHSHSSSFNFLFWQRHLGYASPESSYYHNETVPYMITINEGISINIGLNSRGSITVNLNRAVNQDVNVTLSILSGPYLINFGDKNVTEYNVTFEANTSGDRIVLFYTHDLAGHAEIVCKVANQPANTTINDTLAFTSVNIGRNSGLYILIQVVGWIYFFAWSASFYFQVILNYQRKSVVGLNFDFLALNLLGFTCYSIYNAVLLLSHEVQTEYYQRYKYSRIPVEYNDLFFALHAFILTLVTVIQCFIYEVS